METAKKGIATFDDILQLQKNKDIKIQALGSRATNAQKNVNYLYQKPMINAEKIKEVAGISLPSAYKLINDLEKCGILKEVTGAQRGRSYIYSDYLRLFR